MSRFFIFFIRIYQWTLSPLLGKRCRFYPSCSEYCALALKKHGALRGGWKGLWRILRCGPWSRGGVDEP
ncbi:MAG: membrane protein insertion efficiency factor YidD [Simkaniaceae bacterium]|nr:membrane protein insertion efficiency factor YidD [Candidatus Sacchlamyda saccharinae]